MPYRSGMTPSYITLTCSLLLVLIPPCLSGQTYFVVDEVLYAGNDRTRAYVIEREMDIAPGDTLWMASLDDRLTRNKKQILSTGLFSYAEISIKDWVIAEEKADIIVALQENWYLYPSPIFDFADRSFNVWWQEQGRSLDRVNYGVRLDHINTTGNYDRLKLKAQFGYTRKYEIDYGWPYLRRGGWGVQANLLFAESREINYSTVDNKQVFYSKADDSRLNERYRAGITVTHRPDIYTFQSFRLEGHHRTVDQQVVDLNPQYLGNGLSDLTYLHLAYEAVIDRRTYWQYPLGGYKILGAIKKDGLGIWNEINNLRLEASYEQYYQPATNLIAGLHLQGKRHLIRGPIAYFNNRSIGYGEQEVRGYELYVMDGLDYFIARSQVSYKFVERVIDNRLMPIRQYRKLDIKLFARWSLDTGYANDPNNMAANPLTNRWLLGYGPALDIIVANTVVVKVEYNWNHLGEGGLYFKSNTAF